MATLANFPMVSQLSTVTGDGLPSEDAQEACVAASIDAACRYLLGQPENSVFNADNFKDKGAGQGYVGPTGASQYVAFCASLGVKLAPVNANSAQLVALSHQFLAEGKPVLFTEPSPYAPSDWGFTHVCCFYSDGPGLLTAMDPYIARPVTKSDSDWTMLLLNNTIWTLTKEETAITITINTPGVNAYFQEQDSQHWICKTTGKVIQYAILQAYQSLGGTALCGLSLIGLPMSNEIPIGPNTVKQFFERAVLIWDPSHTIDHPPGSGPVYLAHLYSGQGQDPAVAQLQAEIDKIKGIINS